MMQWRQTKPAVEMSAAERVVMKAAHLEVDGTTGDVNPADVVVVVEVAVVDEAEEGPAVPSFGCSLNCICC